VKTLPKSFYTMPTLANMVMEKGDLKELLLNTGGSVLANGYLYDIIAKHIGAGVYKITLTISP